MPVTKATKATKAMKNMRGGAPLTDKDMCPMNTFEDGCVQDPISLDCIEDDNVFISEEGHCFDLDMLRAANRAKVAEGIIPSNPINRRQFPQRVLDRINDPARRILRQRQQQQLSDADAAFFDIYLAPAQQQQRVDESKEEIIYDLESFRDDYGIRHPMHDEIVMAINAEDRVWTRAAAFAAAYPLFAPKLRRLIRSKPTRMEKLMVVQTMELGEIDDDFLARTINTYWNRYRALTDDEQGALLNFVFNYRIRVENAGLPLDEVNFYEYSMAQVQAAQVQAAQRA